MSRKPAATGSKPLSGLVSSARSGWFTALGRLPSITAKISSTLSFPVRIKSPFSNHQVPSFPRGLSVRAPFRIGADAACRFSSLTELTAEPVASRRRTSGRSARRNTRMTRESFGTLPDTANTNPCRAMILEQGNDLGTLDPIRGRRPTAVQARAPVRPGPRAGHPAWFRSTACKRTWCARRSRGHPPRRIRGRTANPGAAQSGPSSWSGSRPWPWPSDAPLEPTSSTISRPRRLPRTTMRPSRRTFCCARSGFAASERSLSPPCEEGVRGLTGWVFLTTAREAKVPASNRSRRCPEKLAPSPWERAGVRGRATEPPKYPLVFGGAKALVPAVISRGESSDCAAVLPHPAPHPSPLPGEREPVMTKPPPSELRKGGKKATRSG